MIKAAPLPVGGIPLLLFASGLIGIMGVWYLSKLAGIPVEWIFVIIWVFSNGVGVGLDGNELILFYGFWAIKQRIPLDSVEELSILSRLDRGSITGHFKAYAFTWLVVVLWASVDLFVLDWGGNPLRPYMDVFVMATFTLFFLSLTLPKTEKGILRVVAFGCAAFLVVFPLFKWGSKTLVPGMFFVLLIAFMVKVFKKDDLILIVADGKSYLLSSNDGEKSSERSGRPWKMLRLPEGMERVWLMKARGMREVEIADALGISRQAVNKALKDARVKLFEAFFGLAEVFSWEVVRVNAEKGFMVARGKCLDRNVRIYAFYFPGKGIKAFFGGEFPGYVLEHAVEMGITRKPDSDELIKALES
ncbi:helix-turn-helix transcriptional regulator [Thermococcus sp. ES12]